MNCPSCTLNNLPQAQKCVHCGFHLRDAPPDALVETPTDALAPALEGDACLFGGERVLRQVVTQVQPRIWLWVSLLAGSHLLGYPAALAFLAAALDALFFLSVVWQVDCYEEEPWRLVEQTFFWGALPAIILAVIGEVLLHGPARFLVGSAQARWLEAGFVAPIVEEVCKGAVLLTLFRRHREEFDGMLDGLLYGALVGLGFSMTENITYYLRVDPSHLRGLIVARGLVLGMNHACFSACFGLGLGIACDATSPVLRRWAPIAVAGGAAFLWFRVADIARTREARWIAEELAPEVTGGVLTADEAAAIGDVQMRKATRAEAFQEDTYGPANARLRLYALGTELAFAKHKARVDPAHATGARIDAIRTAIVQVKATRAWALAPSVD
jgi:RsiW-degrading membrane proteinase PrsW (M82 family)